MEKKPKKEPLKKTDTKTKKTTTTTRKKTTSKPTKTESPIGTKTQVVLQTAKNQSETTSVLKTKKVASTTIKPSVVTTKDSFKETNESLNELKTQADSSSVLVPQNLNATMVVTPPSNTNTTTSGTNVNQPVKFFKKAYNPGFPNKYGKRKRFCKLCAKGVEHVDYKDVDLLYKYLNPNLKIASRRVTCACSMHQRRIANAIKKARIMALIPFVKEYI